MAEHHRRESDLPPDFAIISAQRVLSIVALRQTFTTRLKLNLGCVALRTNRLESARRWPVLHGTHVLQLYGRGYKGKMRTMRDPLPIR